jgi:hypothetical protein
MSTNNVGLVPITPVGEGCKKENGGQRLAWAKTREPIIKKITKAKKGRVCDVKP